MALPLKISSGQNLRVSVVNTVNAIIGYLRDNAVVGDNSTIAVQRTAAGLVIKALPQGGSRRPTSSKSGGTLELCVITVAPNGGAGACTVSSIDVASNGAWSATGETSTAIALELA